MVLSSNSWNKARFSRMVSVEELDSSLTLLTRHSAKCIKSKAKSCDIGDAKFTSVSATVNSSSDSFFGESTLLTPPGSPYSARTISPETTPSRAFDYSEQRPQHFCDFDVRKKGFVAVDCSSSTRFVP